MIKPKGFEACYHEVTHRCQSKTLSSPDFESTYTNKASLEALAVRELSQRGLPFKSFTGPYFIWQKA